MTTTDSDRPGRGARFAGRPVSPVRWWATAAVVLLPLTAAVWLRPAERAVVNQRALTSTYTFDYTAELPPSSVYDEPVLAFGDAVVRSVVDRVTVTVGHRVAPQARVVDEATLQTRVVVSSSTGWRRVVEAAPDVPIDGGTAEAVVDLDFAALDEVIDEIATEAGARGSVAVSVEAEVVAKVAIAGAVGSTERTTATSASLVFAHGADVIRLVPPAATGNAAPGPDAADEAASAGRQTRTRTVAVTERRAATIGIGSARITVARARAVLTTLLVIVGVVALYNRRCLAVARRRTDGEVAAELGADERTRLDDVPQAVRYAAVRVGTLPGLVSLAEKAGLDVLHHRTATGTEFFVFDGPNTFVHRIEATPAPQLGAEPAEGEPGVEPAEAVPTEAVPTEAAFAPEPSSDG